MKTALIVLVAGTVSLAGAAERTKLFVREVPLTVGGREYRVAAIEREDGSHGLELEQSDGFHVEVVNQLKVPTAIHWHGLVLPNAMDGVPFVTQPPIPPGESFPYDFPLGQSGTYWMHSHYGLQEQFYAAAPLLIWTAEERAKADRQFVVMLSDFSTRSPAEILAHLTANRQPSSAGAMRMMDAPRQELFVQAWDGRTLSRRTVSGAPADIDVTYDALLANRRTIDRPDVLAVQPGESVLLRIVAASSATNFYLDTGKLEAEALAVDGKAVQPLRGNFFQLAIAQRIDLRVKIPADGGAFPILAQGEGTRLLAAVVLATAGAKIPDLPRQADHSTAALDSTQEKLLQATEPLLARTADRTLPCALGGDMATYTWTINGAAYPNRNSLDVQTGDRVEIVFTNPTGMGHPMHLHGHDFQVTAIDGETIAGALRDTVMVPPRTTVRIAFDATNPGLWAFHCHILYHLATGMFTVLKYNGADSSAWKPEETPREAQGLTP